MSRTEADRDKGPVPILKPYTIIPTGEYYVCLRCPLKSLLLPKYQKVQGPICTHAGLQLCQNLAAAR